MIEVKNEKIRKYARRCKTERDQVRAQSIKDDRLIANSEQTIEHQIKEAEKKETALQTAQKEILNLKKGWRRTQDQLNYMKKQQGIDEAMLPGGFEPTK